MERVLCFLAWGLGAVLASGCGGASAGGRDAEEPPSNRCRLLKAQRQKVDPNAPLAGIPPVSPPMTPPVLVSTAEVEYTEEAYNAGAQGIARGRCVITELGAVSECTILEAPAGLEKSVEWAFRRMKYLPATLQGIPIAVDSPIELKVTLPSSPPQKPDKQPGPARIVLDPREMKPPRMISGRDPVYTHAALRTCVEGLMIIRCIITTEGTITNCRTIKTLPYMESPVLDALQSRRYTPVTYQGKPVRLDYMFNIRLALPSAR